MFQITHPKISIRNVPPQRRHASPARAHVEARPARTESYAAPLTLAAVVVLALLLAVTMAIVTALGG